MHHTLQFTYLSLKTLGNEALFSCDADYVGSLEVIATLAQQHTPIAGYCLLEHEMHLLALGDEAQSAALAHALIKALTGSAHHPLERLWAFQPIARNAVTRTLTHIHRLPCQQGLYATADIHKWSSHSAYSDPSKAPHWLSTEPLWQLITPRVSNRVRAYLHCLAQSTRSPTQSHASTQLSRTAQVEARPEPVTTGISEHDIVEKVLKDHQTAWHHLSHSRLARRKLQLAGICCAIGQYLGRYDANNETLQTLFQCSTEELASASRTAAREAGQYIVLTAGTLGQVHQQPYAEAKKLKEKNLTRVSIKPTLAASKESRYQPTLDVELGLEDGFLDLTDSPTDFQTTDEQPTMLASHRVIGQ